MTLHLIDIASWQTTEKRARDPLKLSVAKKAGIDLVNIKTGQGDWYGFRSWMRDYAVEARRLGMGVSTFHWLDNSASGAAQAKIAYARMKELGGPDGMAHQCDCEDTARPATERIWRDYVSAMQDLLGRKIVTYTGDWWWTAPSRNWTGGGLTPYLWAAPNAGYVGHYPGDTSSHWRAGYGGWPTYAVLQYAVSPIEGAGGGNLSKSAIRDPKVWAALTGTGTQEDDEMELTDKVHLRTGGDVNYSDETVTVEQVLSSTNYYTLLVRNLLLAQRGQVDALTGEVAALKATVDALAQRPGGEAPQVDPVAVAKALIAELGRPAA